MSASNSIVSGVRPAVQAHVGQFEDARPVADERLVVKRFEDLLVRLRR
jgi:hypothetical protein